MIKKGKESSNMWQSKGVHIQGHEFKIRARRPSKRNRPGILLQGRGRVEVISHRKVLIFMATGQGLVIKLTGKREGGNSGLGVRGRIR